MQLAKVCTHKHNKNKSYVFIGYYYLHFVSILFISDDFSGQVTSFPLVSPTNTSLSSDS